MAVSLAKATQNSGKLVQASAGLSVEAVRILTGRSTVAPAKGDGRFADPAWEKHPGYRRLQTQVSPPGNPKAHYFVNGRPGPDPHQWRATAERRAGSWWEHRADWTIARSGDERPAPTKLGSRRHPVLGPAPGTYVLEPA